MSFFQTCTSPNPLSPLSALNFNPTFNSSFSISPKNPVSSLHCDGVHISRFSKSFTCFPVSKEPSSDPGASSNPESKPKSSIQRGRVFNSRKEDDNPEKSFPIIKPKTPRRGRKSEAVAVEDYVRDRLEKTFESIRNQDPERFRNLEKVFKDRGDNWIDADSSDEDDDEDDDVSGAEGKKMVVEEDDPDWPVDTDVGWGIRASEFFGQHPIKNVVGEDGVEIDWEGEMDDSWVKEINCLEWESIAFHPSPLIVLVFERYKRASLNWKTLKELEKAIKVYWSSKDKLPPRAVKLDINIERDLAYALKAKECPQILFLRGDKILYRESEFRTGDELVQMIAHFYYNAKRPSWINEAAKFSS